MKKLVFILVLLSVFGTVNADIERDLKLLRESNTRDSGQAFRLIQDLQSRWDEFESDEQKARFYVQESYFYILKSESQKAKKPLRLLLQLADVSEDSRLAAYSLLSQIYMGLNEYQKAFNYLFDGLSIAPRIKDESLQFNSYYAAANVFVELEAFDEALEYVHKANEIAVAMNDNRNQCYAKALVASIFLNQDDATDHEGRLKDVIDYCKGLNLLVIDAHLYKNLAQNYLNHDQLEKSELAYSTALKISADNGYLPDVLQIKLGLARVFLETGELEKAKVYIDEVLQVTAVQEAGVNRKDATELLAKYYDKSNNHTEAYRVLSELTVIQDEMLAEQASKNLAYQKVKYAHLDQNAQIKILDQKNKLLALTSQVEEQSKRNFQLLLVIVLILLTGICLWLWRVKKQKERYRKLSQIDALTNTLNRRYALKLAHEVHHNSLINNSRYCVIIFDLDYFKTVNDRFGHAMGDWVLKKVSDCVKERIRPVDVFGRLGGEEFIVILPQCTSDDAKKFIERCAEAFKEIEHAKLPSDFTVTASFGVAAKSNGESLEELIIEADNAMYQAKRNGRNQTQVY
ncbi:tetratricopeptide repeat-containing diguanylate cyclase [Kangiella taiwanensis]|uniref:diguanylate cyclase n=1 Tax=Kangiella taiwanensis TaxID=1079179 RepID=A0ABP8I619_9GAMM|nr:GGDEF domain-containing protein [Kangiella taiwanensis]